MPETPNAESVRFPENANYGCVDCGSINHTTGDVAWCRVAQAKAEEESSPPENVGHERPTTTLLFAIALPNDFDPEQVDPEQIADEFVAMLNERRRLNWPKKWPESRLFVSAIPAAQWLKASTMRDLRAAIARERAAEDKEDE